MKEGYHQADTTVRAPPILQALSLSRADHVALFPSAPRTRPLENSCPRFGTLLQSRVRGPYLGIPLPASIAVRCRRVCCHRRHCHARAQEWELMGEASLKVCARGTSEQSFLRRDDCDGCLCPAGSVWVHYKDPRFVGKGMDTCVPEKQWKDCISSWACGKHQPNYCWEFIWSGGRQDPEHGDYKVLVDSCSLHGGCFFMIQRWRRWELLSDSLPALHCDATIKTVGVDPVDIERTNATLNIHPEIRGWGFPSSVQTLLKLGPSSDPAEWRASHQTDIEQKYVTGRRNKAWQVVSRYRIHAYDYHGQTHEVAAWDQREHRSTAPQLVAI